MALPRWLQRVADALKPKQSGGRHRAKPGQRGFRPGDIPPSPPRPPAPPPVLPPVEIPDFGGGHDLVGMETRAIAADSAAIGIAWLNADGPSDPERDVAELRRDIGGSKALQVVRQQNESAHDYAVGNPNTGHNRFVNQVETMESLLGASVAWEWLTDRKGRRTYRVATKFVQWFYYHAARHI
jgi:hypothetical protein